AGGALGRGVQGPLAGRDRPAARRRLRVLVWPARLDRAGLQTPQERWLGLAIHAHDRPGTGGATVAGDGGGDLVVFVGRRRSGNPDPDRDGRAATRGSAGPSRWVGDGRRDAVGRGGRLGGGGAARAGDQCVWAWPRRHRQHLTSRGEPAAGAGPSRVLARPSPGGPSPGLPRRQNTVLGSNPPPAR